MFDACFAAIISTSIRRASAHFSTSCVPPRTITASSLTVSMIAARTTAAWSAKQPTLIKRDSVTW
jgi:hypothetical protein